MESSLRKRALPEPDEAHGRSRSHRSCVPAGLSMASYLVQLCANAALLFSVLPLDIVGMLRTFLIGPTKGAIAHHDRFVVQGSFDVRPDPFSQTMLCAVDLRTCALIFVVPNRHQVVFCDSASGALLRDFAPKQHALPERCVIDSDGTLYVYEELWGNVHVFSADETRLLPKLRVTQWHGPVCMCLSADESLFYFAGRSACDIDVYCTTTGALLWQMGSIYDPNLKVIDLAPMSDGRLAVACERYVSEGVIVFDAAGTFVQWLDYRVAEPSALIMHIAVDGADRVYMACRSRSDHNSTRFETLPRPDGKDGGQLCLFERSGCGVLWPAPVVAILIDAAGRLIVDTGHEVTFLVSK